jgi:hypothetical protein
MNKMTKKRMNEQEKKLNQQEIQQTPGAPEGFLDLTFLLYH